MDPFATLGLPYAFEIDRKALEARYRELQRALHPDRHASAPASHRRMNLSRAVEVNEAYAMLKDELRRAASLLAHLGAETEGGAPESPADPEFLMDVMELREALGDAKAQKDLATVARLADDVRARQQRSRQAFAGAVTGPEIDLDAAHAALGRMRYFRRFLDEVAVIEEEALG